MVCLIVGAALWHRHHRESAWSGPVAWVAVGALAIEAALGITSIGAYMLPVVVLLAVGVRLVAGRGPAPAAASQPVTER